MSIQGSINSILATGAQLASMGKMAEEQKKATETQKAAIEEQKSAPERARQAAFQAAQQKLHWANEAVAESRRGIASTSLPGMSEHVLALQERADAAREAFRLNPNHQTYTNLVATRLRMEIGQDDLIARQNKAQLRADRQREAKRAQQEFTKKFMEGVPLTIGTKRSVIHGQEE